MSTCGYHCATTDISSFNANSEASWVVHIHHEGLEHVEVIHAAVPADYWRCNTCTDDSRPLFIRSSAAVSTDGSATQATFYSVEIYDEFLKGVNSHSTESVVCLG